MRKIICILYLAIFTIGIYAQKGTPNYLTEKRGFKYLKLADPISNYMDRIKPMDQEPGTYIVTDSTLLNIGDEIKLSHIFIKTYNDSIYSISLMAKPEYKHKIRNVLVAAFGAWTFRPNKFMERYNWMSSDQKIDLLFDSENRQWCYVIYKDNDLDLKKGKAENNKNKKIADDL